MDDEQQRTMNIAELNCRKVWREISNYLDGEVDQELRARLEAHFKKCPRCSAVLDDTRDIVKLVGEGIEFRLPPGFSEKLRESIKRS
jgi:anti-sigma factor RsiW